MKTSIEATSINSDFRKRIEEISGVNLMDCYQCGRCSAGCPAAYEMDYLPNQIIRLSQLGKEKILESNAIWKCVSCFICSERCPRGIDVAGVFEALRQIVLRKSYNFTKFEELESKELEELPPIALVANFRKFTS